MANDLKTIILAQLGDPPPPTRAERNAVYERVRAGFDAMYAGEEASLERAAHALALQRAIETIEAELAAGQATQGDVQPPSSPPAPAQDDGDHATTRVAPRALAIAAAVGAMLAVGGWYLLSQRQQPADQRPVASRTTIDPQKDLEPAVSDKARSFQEALRNGDAGTVALLLNSGYRPTRVELRGALLQAKYTPQIKAAIVSLTDDVRDIACSFTTLSEVRKPLTRSSLFDAEDAFAVMRQIGQDEWRAMCASEGAKWREALAKMEQQSAQYNKPDAEKKSQADACVRRFSAREAMERWEQAHCAACPESHSSCDAYCPQAPKAADAEEARFFNFNRSDMAMAMTAAQGPNKGRAELYCNLQYLTRPTDFDLANLQRFRDLVSLLK
jgi:hypothetical protein